MVIIGWVMLGLAVGLIASRIVRKSGEAIARDLAIGAVGALVGGFLSTGFSNEGLAEINLYSMPAAAIGAAVALVLHQAIVDRRDR